MPYEIIDMVGCKGNKKTDAGCELVPCALQLPRCREKVLWIMMLQKHNVLFEP